VKRSVDPARALFLWNRTSESLTQIAERFVGVKQYEVRDAIKRAIETGLGQLARPLPENLRAEPRPKKFREPRAPRMPREPRAARPALIDVQIPDHLPKAAPFNTEVEEIVSNSDRTFNFRAARRELDQLILEWAQFVMDGGYTEWCGKLPYPWVDRVRIRTALVDRAGRRDLWKYLQKIYRTYTDRHPVTSLEINHSGDMRVQRKSSHLREHAMRVARKASLRIELAQTAAA
jgi:hypothetical protein